MMNGVLEVVLSPKDRLVVGSHWIYKIKYVVGDNMENSKDRLMEKGYVQKEGIDYEETFTPVSRYTSIRSIISLEA